MLRIFHVCLFICLSRLLLKTLTGTGCVSPSGSLPLDVLYDMVGCVLLQKIKIFSVLLTDVLEIILVKSKALAADGICLLPRNTFGKLLESSGDAQYDSQSCSVGQRACGNGCRHECSAPGLSFLGGDPPRMVKYTSNAKSATKFYNSRG